VECPGPAVRHPPLEPGPAGRAMSRWPIRVSSWPNRMSPWPKPS